MTILLSDGNSTVELPDDLNWVDEYDWVSARQSFTRSVSGSLIIQAAARTAGRPITLEPPDNGGWITRAALDAVKAYADTPDLQMTLTMRNANYTVMFRSDEGEPITAEPLMFFADPAPEHYALATFRFITV